MLKFKNENNEITLNVNTFQSVTRAKAARNIFFF